MLSRTIRHSRLASSGPIERSAIYEFLMLLPIPGEQLLIWTIFVEGKSVLTVPVPITYVSGSTFSWLTTRVSRLRNPTKRSTPHPPLLRFRLSRHGLNNEDTKMNLTLHVLLMKDSGTWSAQCLEHNIAAQGATTNEAISELARTIVGELSLRAARGREGLDDIPRAPDHYWTMFGTSAPLNMPAPPLFRPDHETPPAYMIPEFRECRVA